MIRLSLAWAQLYKLFKWTTERNSQCYLVSGVGGGIDGVGGGVAAASKTGV